VIRLNEPIAGAISTIVTETTGRDETPAVEGALAESEEEMGLVVAWNVFPILEVGVWRGGRRRKNIEIWFTHKVL